MCQANFFATNMMACRLKPSSVSMSTSMEIAFNHLFCIRLLLLGSQGGASSLEASPDSMDHWNWYTKLGPFFPPLLLTVTFNQMTIKHSLYMQKYTSTIQKLRMWFFSSFGIRPGRKVMWSKVLQVLWTRGSISLARCGGRLPHEVLRHLSFIFTVSNHTE